MSCVLNEFNNEMNDYKEELNKIDKKSAINFQEFFNIDYAEKLLKYYLERCKYRHVFAFI